MKFSPINDYIGPFIEDAFCDLIADGFLKTAYGGAQVGAYLCDRPDVDTIHITGSRQTYDAIVWGIGIEAAERKARTEPGLKNESRVI